MSSNIGNQGGNIGNGEHSSGSSPVLAVYADNTRTQATYSPAAQGVVAMSSDLDIVLTPPTGTTKNYLHWDIFGEVDSAAGRIGFVVYRDVDGGGFSLLPNSRDGSANYYSVIGTPARDANHDSTGNITSISIIDESPTIGSVCTYRVYVANTDSALTDTFHWNTTVGAVGSAKESGLSSCRGECIQ